MAELMKKQSISSDPDAHSIPGWVDSHCHFDFAEFDHDRDAVWQHSHALGVRHLLIPGIDRQQSEQLVSFCSNGPTGPDGSSAWLFAQGLHPYFLARHQPQDLDWLERQLSNADSDALSGPVAVGEFGLDFRKHTSADERQQQLFYFDAQLQLAKRFKKPVVLHGVGAHDQIAAAIRRSGFGHGGVIHAFSGSEQQARRYLDLGFRLGLGGLLLSPRAHRLHRTVRRLPLESWLLETDAPDMTPAAVLPQRNSPQFLPLVAVALARLKDVGLEELKYQQWQSFKRLFILNGC